MQKDNFEYDNDEFREIKIFLISSYSISKTNIQIAPISIDRKCKTVKTGENCCKLHDRHNPIIWRIELFCNRRAKRETRKSENLPIKYGIVGMKR